jgi:hypothetical protein
MELDLLNLAVAFVAPVLVGLVTRASVAPGIKALLLLALTSAGTVVQQLIDASGAAGFPWRDALLAAAVTFAMAAATHFGLYKPTGVSAWAQDHGVTDDRRLAA